MSKNMKKLVLDISKYDDPEFYADFILSVENTSDNLAYMLVTVRNYVAEFISIGKTEELLSVSEAESFTSFISY